MREATEALTWDIERFACAVLWERSKFHQLSSVAWMKTDTCASNYCRVTLSRTYCPLSLVKGNKARWASRVHRKTWTCNEHVNSLQNIADQRWTLAIVTHPLNPYCTLRSCLKYVWVGPNTFSDCTTDKIWPSIILFPLKMNWGVPFGVDPRCCSLQRAKSQGLISREIIFEVFQTRLRSVERGICPIAARYVMLCYDVSDVITCQPLRVIASTSEPRKSYFLNCWQCIPTISSLYQKCLETLNEIYCFTQFHSTKTVKFIISKTCRPRPSLRNPPLQVML